MPRQLLTLLDLGHHALDIGDRPDRPRPVDNAPAVIGFKVRIHPSRADPRGTRPREWARKGTATGMTTTEELTTNVHDTALIFEGGGMRDAYTAPAVVALLESEIFVDYVAGVSAGSSNLCNYASRDIARARKSFVDIATDPRFGGMKSFFRGDGYFNSKFIYQDASLPGDVLPFDWQTFMANPIQIRVGAFNASRGQERWFTKDDITRLEDLLIQVRASSSLPIIMPPSEIDGETYYDGALGPNGGIPLDIALKDGYQKFLVIMTRPREYVKEPQHLPSPAFFRRRFRDYPAVADGIINRWRRYNAGRKKLFELESQGHAMLFFPDNLHIANTERRVDRLAETYEAGEAQVARELPKWKEFLGF